MSAQEMLGREEPPAEQEPASMEKCHRFQAELHATRPTVQLLALRQRTHVDPTTSRAPWSIRPDNLAQPSLTCRLVRECARDALGRKAREERFEVLGWPG